MARVCSALNVPCPERGYWVKLQVGKAPPRPELSEASQATSCLGREAMNSVHRDSMLRKQLLHQPRKSSTCGERNSLSRTRGEAAL